MAEKGKVNPPAVLKTGEIRNDYIRRRFKEGISKSDIVKEINSPELYAGAEGKSWPAATVYQICKDLALTPGDDAPPVPLAENDGADDTDDEPTAVREPESAEATELRRIELSPEEIDEIRKKAVATVERDIRNKLKADLLEKETARVRQAMALEPAAGEQIIQVTIDLAPYAPFIQLDLPHGLRYMHGNTYSVRQCVAATLLDEMAKTWRHQEEISGQQMGDFYRQRRDTRVGARGVQNAPSVAA